MSAVSTQVLPGSRELATLSKAALVDVTFVQVAAGARVDGPRLTLLDLAPTTIWLLRGAPDRVGYMATGTFLDLWWSPDSGLASASLMADLGLVDPDAARFGYPRFRVRAPRIRGSGLQFDVEVLAGMLPGHCGACALFVGPGADLGPGAGPPGLSQ
jgi:hypothetical protein